jgi:hypothetical protein
MEEIPKEYISGNTKWHKFFRDHFYRGIRNVRIKGKDGINITEALNIVTAITRSMEPQHEHKSAAVAYLCSLWFEDAQWEPDQPEPAA